jgi:Ca-activated chloride channel homolog
MNAPQDLSIRLGSWVTAAPGDGEDEWLALLAVEPVPRPAGHERAPLDLILAVDRSSSMVGPRIAAAVEAVRQIGLLLDERDRLGVVAFDARARTVMQPRPPDPAAVARAVLDLTGLGVGLGTNIGEGWRKAMQLTGLGAVSTASKTILLLTDGMPSRGKRKATELASMARTGYQRGIVTTTVGMGHRFDEALLAEMATAGGGAFRYVQYDDDAAAVAREEVQGLTGRVADDAVLHLGFATRLVSRFELLHDLRARPDDDGAAVELGRLFADTPRHVLVRLWCRQDARQLGASALSFRRPDGALAELEPARIELPGDDAERETAAAQVGAAYVPLRVARWQRKIWERGNDRSMKQLLRVFDDAQQELQHLPEPLTASPEAQDALQRFEATCNCILEEGRVSQDTRKRLTEDTQITLHGTSFHKAWGKKK